jgi:hypothetical protein
MAVPHYNYIMLKMPGPNEIIIVKGNFELSDTCDKEFHKMAQTFGMTSEYPKLKGGTEHNTLRRRSIPPYKALDDTPNAKKIWVHQVTRVNSANVLDGGLRIEGRGRQMNSKVKIGQTR